MPFRLIYILSLTLFCISGINCTEPFQPNVKEFDDLYVIDGLLTSNSSECFIKISKTFPYNETSDSIKKISNAYVSIIDEHGDETVLQNTDEGKYEFFDKSISFLPNLKYKLRVTTNELDTLESSFETLPESVAIDNLYFTFSQDQNKPGIYIRISTFDPNSLVSYFYWEFSETWEFSVPFVSRNLPECEVCYVNTRPPKFIIESAVRYPDNKIIGYPIQFIDNSTNRLRIKYSINVKQYTLSETSYQFLYNLNESIEETGTLFDKIPTTLVGNIKNLSHPEIPVLGNFQVSGVSEKRIFIYHNEVMNQMDIPTGFEHCILEYLDQYSGRLDSLIGAGWRVMDSIFIESDILVGIVNRSECFDCTRNGSSEVPEFWYSTK
jgi:hypothetical protein